MGAAVPEVIEKKDHSVRPVEGAKSRGEADQDLRIVTFSLGRKAYGINIMQVKEISSAQRFTYVPNTASYVRGVFNLRGEIIPIIDMRLFFDLEITGERSELDITRNNEIYEDLIILTLDYVNIGIIVDHIYHVIAVERSMVQRSHPLFREMDVPYIEGIVDYDKQLYIILAMDKILEPQLDSSESGNFDLSVALANIANIDKGRAPKKTAKPVSPVPKVDKADKVTSKGASAKDGQISQNLLKQPPPVANAAEQSAPSADIANTPSEVMDSRQTPAEIIETVAKESSSDDDFKDILPPSDGEEFVVDEKDLAGLNQTQKLLARCLIEDGFRVTAVNADVAEQKWKAWCKSKNVDVFDEQALRSMQNRQTLLALIESDYHNEYWPESFRDVIEKYFQGRTGNLNVWHAGCGGGEETYSLSAALVGVASEANLQVRAADSELLEVSEAPLQSVKVPTEIPHWLREYLSEEKGSNGHIFAKALRDRIIFEYQDVVHATPHAMLDLVVIRDLLSKYSQAEQEYVLNTISGALKEDGLVVVGDNENLNTELWDLIESVPLKIYRKRSL